MFWDADANAIPRLVDAIEFYRPLHLFILTESEEREIGFAERQGCIHVLLGRGLSGRGDRDAALGEGGGRSRPEAAHGRQDPDAGAWR